MKTKLTQCLALSTLAIGMSSTVVAQEGPNGSKDNRQSAWQAFDTSSETGNGLVVLKADNKGKIVGYSCINSDKQADLAESDCILVRGEASTMSGNYDIRASGFSLANDELHTAEVY